MPTHCVPSVFVAVLLRFRALGSEPESECLSGAGIKPQWHSSHCRPLANFGSQNKHHHDFLV